VYLLFLILFEIVYNRKRFDGCCQIAQAEHKNMTVKIDFIDDNNAIMDAGPAHRLIP
jgi:hypothetical protein